MADELVSEAPLSEVGSNTAKLQERLQRRKQLFESLIQNNEEKAVTLSEGRFTDDEMSHHGLRAVDQLSDRDFLNRKVMATLEHVYDNHEDFFYITPSAATSNRKDIARTQILQDDDASEADKGLDFLVRSFPHHVIPAIAAIEDTDKMKVLLGMCVDRMSLPKVLDYTRLAIDLSVHDPDTQQNSSKGKLERVGKILLGLDPDDPRIFYKSLNDLYKNADFDNYPTNQEATARETEMITKMIAEQGMKRPTIVEIGCGTGRIPNHLAEAFPPGQVGTIIGIDPSPDLLDQAKIGDTTGKVRYQEGTLENSNLEPKSADAVIIIGRTLTHLRNNQDFVRTFIELERILKDEGVVIFDLPNKDKGAYETNRARYASILQDLKIPISVESAMDYYDRVVDSPDKGNSLFDRYVPDITEPYRKGGNFALKDDIARASGISIEQVESAPIYGWEGAENNYFIGKLQREKNTRDYFSSEEVAKLDLNEASNETLLRIPPENYQRFLEKLAFGEVDDIAKRLPVVAERFIADLAIPLLRSQENMQRYEIARRIAESTGMMLWRLSSRDYKIDPSILQSLYETMHNENEIVQEYSFTLLPHLIRLDYKNQDSENFLNLHQRFNDEISEHLNKIGEPAHRVRALELIRTGWAEGLLPDLTTLFLHNLPQVQNETEAFSLCYVFSEPLRGKLDDPEFSERIDSFLDQHPEINSKYGSLVRKELVG